MNVNITNRNDNKVSDSLRDRISAWLEGSAERYEAITSAQVTIEKSDERSAVVEATIHVAGKDVFAKSEAANLYAALDGLEDKIDRQLDKIHQKHVNKKGTPKPEQEDADTGADIDTDDMDEDAVLA